MPLTYSQNSGSSVTATNNTLSFSGLDYRPEIGDTIEVYNDTTKLTETTDYTLDTTNKNVLFVVNNSALTFTPGTTISVYRIAKKDNRAIDFQNASVLTEADLDNSAFQTFHIAQEALDTAEQSITVNADGTFNANNARIVNLADPDGDQDAATKAWVNSNANTTTVAGSIANVNTVAGSISNVNTVATNISNVNAVNSNVTNVNKVAAVDSDVTTVAGIDSNVTTVAGVSGNVSTVAGISSDVTGVANISSAVSAVNSNASNINAVNSNSSNINTVAGNNSNITTVAGIDSNVTTVAGISGNVTTVATNNANVTAVANNIADVNNFADTYFGTSSSASGPTGTFTAGDLYFSTYNSENKLKVYNGSSWQNATSAVEGIATITEFTPNGSDTHFAFTHDVGLQIVFLNGVRLIQGTDYNSVNSSSSTSNITSGTATHLHFSTPPVNGDVLSAMGFGTVTSTAVVPVSGGTFSGNVTVPNLIIDDGGNIGSASDTDALTIDSSGNVGIGTSSPSSYYYDTLTIDHTNSNGGITLKAGTTEISGIAFADGTTGNEQYRGRILYYHNEDRLSLGSAGDTHLHINSSGNVGVGDSSADAKMQINQTGSDYAVHITNPTNTTNYGNGLAISVLDENTTSYPLYINSNSVTAESGNHRFSVRADGETKITGGNLVISTVGKGITFQDATNDNTVSNQSYTLDQYETGDWTPVLTNGTTNAGLDSSSAGIYTRIGNCVFISGRIEGDGSTTIPSGSLRIEGLPFNSGNGVKYYNSISVSQSSGLNISASENIVMRTSLDTDRLILFLWDSSSGTTNLQGSEFTNDGDIMFSGVYFVD